jgi:hypothetical protein
MKLEEYEKVVNITKLNRAEVQLKTVKENISKRYNKLTDEQMMLLIDDARELIDEVLNQINSSLKIG